MSTRTHYILLLCLVVFHLTAGIVWIGLNATVPGWDAAGHTNSALTMAYYLHETLPGLTFNPITFLQISRLYPPLIPLLGSFVLLFGYFSLPLLQILSIVFFAICIIVVDRFAYVFTKKHTIALFSAILFSFSPAIIEQSRYFMLDIPLTILILAAYIAIQKKQLFLATALLILVQLTKWNGFLFLLPMLMFNYRMWLSKKGLYAILIFFAVVLPWYLVNWQTLSSSFGPVTLGEPDDPALLSLSNFMYYPRIITMFQITTAGLLFFFVGVFFAIKDHHKKLILLFLSLAWILIVFTCIQNKNVRALFPAIPFITTIIAYGLWRLKKIGLLLGAVYVAFLFFTFFALSFGIPLQPNYKFTIKITQNEWIDLLYLDTKPLNLLYDTRAFPYETIVQEIKNDPGGLHPSVFIAIDTPELNRDTLLLLYNVSFAKNPAQLRKRAFPAPNDYLYGADVVKNMEEATMILVNKNRKEPLTIPKSFEIFTTIPLPDGDEVFVFRKASF